MYGTIIFFLYSITYVLRYVRYLEYFSVLTIDRNRLCFLRPIWFYLNYNKLTVVRQFNYDNFSKFFVCLYTRCVNTFFLQVILSSIECRVCIACTGAPSAYVYIVQVHTERTPFWLKTVYIQTQHSSSSIHTHKCRHTIPTDQYRLNARIRDLLLIYYHGYRGLGTFQQLQGLLVCTN